MSKKFPTLPALFLALAAAGLVHPAAQAKSDISANLIGPTVTLSLTRSDGPTMDIVVDGGGGFTQAYYSTPAEGLVQDFSYDSLVMVNLTEGASGDIVLTHPTRAESSFSVQGLDVRLKQTLSAGPLAGSFLLTQAYRITNPGSEPATVDLYRYQDTDLQPGAEAGYIARGSNYAYLVGNLAPDGSQITPYIGVAAYTGHPLTEARAAVLTCCRAYEVAPEANRTVPDDAASDGLSDGLADRAISRRATLTLTAGETTTITTKTLMGRTALGSLSELPKR